MSTAIHKRYYSYLNTAAAILQQYQGGQPFHLYIKNYFSNHKKIGSKDRKQITALCYGYFRLGHACNKVDTITKLLLGVKHTKSQTDEAFTELPEYKSLPTVTIQNIFPWKEQLSRGVDVPSFEQSHLAQPDMFLRIRPGRAEFVLHKLQEAGITYKLEGDVLRLHNHVKLEGVVVLDKDAVVQDFSSQKVGALLQVFKSQISNTAQKITVWDCCAASGGKSILATDILKNIQLTASDMRPAILQNLKARFAKAGLQNYKSFTANLTHANDLPKHIYDLVIADVPCSGSGTWARTPEALCYFEEAQIAVYAGLQKKILNNIAPRVKPGGYLLYITCSVFAKENEQQVEDFLQQGFTVVTQKIIEGYNLKADTMFAALLKKEV